ncbi:hypothetical protein DW015_09875 [Ruminococcus sp. AF37-20]|nr:hypothetical protein DW015_09875 [Ruminococcus sp. AF37-20]
MNIKEILYRYICSSTQRIYRFLFQKVS